MLSGAPISSLPLSTSSSIASSSYSGLEIFVFNLKINMVVNFTLELKY